MKNLMKLISIVTVLGSSASMASKIDKIEIFPAYPSSHCREFQVDSAGTVEVSLVKLAVTETASTLSLSVEEQLQTCKLSIDSNGVKSLAWENINPFKGYEVQYYDSETNSIQNRKEIIDVNSKANRFEFGAYLEERNLVFRNNLSQSEANTAVGTLEIKKLDLLNQNDIDQLNAGTAVKKTIMLIGALNVTIKIKGQIFDVGDQYFGARNVIITFVKENHGYKIRNISL